ncbi:hypothetical protein MDOR_02730 [Mycolicibacterium doricum]|uniref:Uncharacterized protein n=1 Tax=Mycolicibacterium doricum TaxID=126673 RepID=A0A1X1TEP0_9MYCO|nr:hypothetical protein [Mycolicibacterium doricum]MCV7267861.1 hypothetical protein [Mycolicibacterium doricum]ORV43029.1 hypothetical protein AWC01_07605 [Mycolicibacterium doricum]BBZ06104.1 hypothetical protein MDOR_02730 [Mycolicibacterium doricum]
MRLTEEQKSYLVVAIALLAIEKTRARMDSDFARVDKTWAKFQTRLESDALTRIRFDKMKRSSRSDIGVSRTDNIRA